MNASLKWVAVFLFFIRISLEGTAQILYPFQTYTVNDGLSQSSVYCLFQDSKGYIWLGTGDGLNRFDGYDFSVFKHQVNDSTSLTNASVRGIVEDADDNLWIATDRGLNLKAPGKDEFSIPHSLSRFEKFTVYTFTTLGDEVIFYVPWEGIYSYDLKKDDLKLIYNEKQLIPNTFLVDGKKIWFANGNGEVIALQLTSGSIRNYKINFNFKNLSDLQLLKFGSDIFLRSPHSLYKLDTENKAFEKYGDWPANIKYCFIDHQKNFWLSTASDELLVLNQAFDTIDLFTIQNGQKFIFSKTYDVLEDPSGNIWMAVEGTGVFKFSPHQRKFHHVKMTGNKNNQLETNFIKCFAETKRGIIFIGTYEKGLYLMNMQNQNIQKIDVPDLQNATITSLLPEKNNELWIGTSEKLYLFDLDKKELVEIPEQLKQLKDINYIYHTTDRSTLFLTKTLTYQIDKKNNITILPNSIYNAYSVFENLDGSLWFSTNVGIKICSPEGEILEKPFAFPEIKVRSFYQDKNNTVWVGTEAGIAKIDRNNNIKWLGIKEGLPDNFVYSILPGKENEIWISTNKGLAKFDKTKNTFRNFGIIDGLQSWEFNTNAALKTSDGTMFFGGVNGFNYFDPAEISNTKFPPNVVLSWFKVNGEEINASNSSDLKLTIPQNTVTFQLAALEYTHPAGNQYAFKLMGLEEEWNYTNTRRTAQYSKLPPGKYALWAKAANIDGFWSDPKELLHFEILPPFWDTAWFKVSVLIVAAGIFGMLIFIISTAKMRKKMVAIEQQRQLELLRNQISRDIHDDIGAGLSKIALLSDLADSDYKRNKTINGNLHKVSSMAREMMNSLQEIIWAINPKHDDLKNMVTFFRNYIGELFEETKMKAHFEVPEELHRITLSPDTRRNLFLILKESLNNILKHAEAKNIWVILSIEYDTIKLSIRDDGKGFTEPCARHKGGNGIGNIYSRAEQINGKACIESSPGSGTCVIVNIPINENSIKM